jgi:hypothetical protein
MVQGWRRNAVAVPVVLVKGAQGWRRLQQGRARQGCWWVTLSSREKGNQVREAPAARQELEMELTEWWDA